MLIGLILKHGESVCAPMMEKAFPGFEGISIRLQSVLGLCKQTYDRKPTYRPLFANRKGHNRGSITGQIIFTPYSTRCGPRLLFLNLLESCFFKELLG
jgi:hypothetical protein